MSQIDHYWLSLIFVNLSWLSRDHCWCFWSCGLFIFVIITIIIELADNHLITIRQGSSIIIDFRFDPCLLSILVDYRIDLRWLSNDCRFSSTLSSRRLSLSIKLTFDHHWSFSIIIDLLSLVLSIIAGIFVDYIFVDLRLLSWALLSFGGRVDLPLVTDFRRLCWDLSIFFYYQLIIIDQCWIFVNFDLRRW